MATDLLSALRDSASDQRVLDLVLSAPPRQLIPLGLFNQRLVYLDPAVPVPHHQADIKDDRFFTFQPGPAAPGRGRESHRADSRTSRSSSPHDSGYYSESSGSEVGPHGDRQSSTMPDPQHMSVQQHLLLGVVVASQRIGEEDEKEDHIPTSYIVSRHCSSDPGLEPTDSSLWIMSDDLLQPIDARQRPDRRRGRVGIDGTASFPSRPICAQLHTDFDRGSALKMINLKTSFKIGRVGETTLEQELDEEHYQKLLSQFLELEFKHGYSSAEVKKIAQTIFTDSSEAECWYHRNYYGPTWKFQQGKLSQAIHDLTTTATPAELSKIKDGIVRGDEITPTFYIQGAKKATKEAMTICWLKSRMDFYIPGYTAERTTEGISAGEGDTPGSAVTIHGSSQNGSTQNRIVLPLGRLRHQDSGDDARFFVVKDLTCNEYGLLASAYNSGDDLDGEHDDEDALREQVKPFRTAGLPGQDKPFSYATLPGLDLLSRQGEPQTVGHQVILSKGYTTGPVVYKEGVLKAGV